MSFEHTSLASPNTNNQVFYHHISKLFLQRVIMKHRDCVTELILVRHLTIIRIDGDVTQTRKVNQEKHITNTEEEQGDEIVKPDKCTTSFCDRNQYGYDK